MKKIILSILMLSILLVSFGIVSAETLILENKDSAPNWNVLDSDGIQGTLTYNEVGSEFVYDVTATVLLTDTDYSLIYYMDPWDTHQVIKIGEAQSDSSGDLTMSGSTDLSMMLPHEDDKNDGAKIWLVPSSDYNEGTKKFTIWNATNYLFEKDELITYTDIDELCITFNTPEEGDYVSGDDLDLEWDYDSCTSSEYVLQYKEDTCDGTSDWNTISHVDTATTDYPWDISGLDDGDYCLKLSVDSDVGGYSGIFTIDRTAPTIEFDGEPYFTQVDVEINIKAYVEDENELDEWELDFGDETSTEEGILGTISETHTYEEEDIYTITLTATDKAGNEASKTSIVVVNDEEPDWVIQLYSDEMNFFSIPLMPESTDIEDVLPEDVSDNAEKIWSYQEGKWKYNTPISSGWSSTSSKIQDIESGYGYIIFMNEDSIAYGNGKESEPETPTNQIILTAGWNLIGLYGTEEKIVDIALAGLKSVQSGNPYWSEIKDSQEVVLTNTNSMEPTKTYWINMNSNDFPIPEDKTFLY